MIRFLRPLLAIVGVVGVLALLAPEADARPKAGVGSRGTRTYTPPPPTNTAPTTARPIERSATPPSSAAAGAPRAATPAGAPAAAKPGLFNRPGFLGGLAAGMLGAGLLGLMFGQGLFGNLGGLASILGLLIQLALVGGVAYLVIRWWRGRSQPQPAFAGMPPGAQQALQDAPPPAEAPKPLQSSNPYAAYGGGGSQQQQPGKPTDEIGVKPEDYETFERLLVEIQTVYGKEDINALRALVTPEMMTYLSEELADNASRGVAAQLSNVKLLQGDLSEAWAEGNVEYATVAMRYEIVDAMVDRNTRRVVEGDANNPQEVTELWTFMRSRGGGKWLLSAIQQVDGDQQS